MLRWFNALASTLLLVRWWWCCCRLFLRQWTTVISTKEVTAMAVAAEALPKTSPRWPEARCLRSRVFWVLRAQVFHAGHVLEAGVRPSQSRWSLGKLPAKSKDIVAMAASQALVMGRLAREAFFWASFRWLMYLGMRGSSSHQPCISMTSVRMSVASRL